MVKPDLIRRSSRGSRSSIANRSRYDKSLIHCVREK